jgi:hypothetical protein
MARYAERTLVLDLLNSAEQQVDPTAYVEALHPWDAWGDVFFAPGQQKLTEQLRNEYVMRVITNDKSPQRIRWLREHGKHAAEKYCLLSGQSPVWQTGMKSTLIETVRAGQTDNIIFVNCKEFFDMILYGANTGLDYVTREDCVSILKDELFISVLWQP